MGMGIGQRRTGTATASGIVELAFDPDYSRGTDVVKAWLGVDAYDHISLQVRDLAGEIALEGNNGDPTDADDWYEIDSLTADGVTTISDFPVSFLRVNAKSITSGTAVVHLNLE